MKKIITLSIITLALSSCDVFTTDAEYKVKCSSCSITYENEGGNTEQGSVSGSWSTGFEVEDGQFLYISAQNNNSSGTVSVEIYVDGDKVENASSSGAYVIATASHSVGN